jgi:hypothetical protein
MSVLEQVDYAEPYHEYRIHYEQMHTQCFPRHLKIGR